MKFIVGLVLLLSGIAMADTLDTAQPSPFLIVVSTSNASALGVSGTYWGATAAWPEIPLKANGLKVAFYAFDDANLTPDGNTFQAQLFIADFGSNAQMVFDVNCTIGKARLSHNPVSFALFNAGAADPCHTWVDTTDATVTTKWKGGVTSQNYDGSDDEASLIFDRQSGKRIWARIYGRSSAHLTIWCVCWYY